MDKIEISMADSPKISPLTASGTKADKCCDVNHAEHTKFEESTGPWDRWGLWLSSLCAIHCLVTPFLVLALPVLGGIFEQAWVHVAMALFVVPVGVTAFWSGYKHHHKKNVLILGLAGLLFVAGASLLPHEWVEFHELDVVTVIGSFCLITAHILNRRACQCENPHHSH